MEMKDHKQRLEVVSNPDLEVGSPTTSKENNLSNRPWQYKLLALVVALFFSIGSHYATNNMNALKDLIKSELGLSNSDFGVAQSTVFMINTLMPLIGGVLMDRFGTVYGAVASSSTILLGNLIIAIACHVGSLQARFVLILVGRMFHGFGSGMIVVAQETILGKWFSNSAMATVIGLQIGASRLSNYAAHATAAMVVQSTGSIAGPMWVVVGMCLLSWSVTLLYATILYRSGGEVISEATKKSQFSLRRLLYLPAGFWIMPFGIMVLAGIWTPFLGSVADYIKVTYPDKSLNKVQQAIVAGWKSSVSLLIPIFLSPVLGGLIDKFGHRSPIVLTSAILTTISMAMLTFSTDLLYPGLILFSISLTIGPVGLTSSIPLMLPHDMIGTGIGVHKTAMSVGIAFLHLGVGLVQDLTPNKDYSVVMPCLFFISIIGIFLTILYFIYSYRYLHRLFEVPAPHRRNILQSHQDDFITDKKTADLPAPNRRQWFLSSLLVFFIILVWIFFLFMLIFDSAPVTKKLSK